jgi:very-short-patch-repair endonuclease
MTNEQKIYIWNYIARQNRPLSTRDILRYVKRKYRGLNECDLNDILAVLRDEEAIKYKRGFWHLLNSPTTSKRNGIDSGVVELTGINTYKSGKGQVKSVVAIGTSSQKVTCRSGRWETFRRLVDYYIACIEQAEMPQTLSYLERLGDTWLPISQNVPWDRIKAGAGFTVSMRQEWASFHKNRSRRGDDQTIFLGYPIKYIKRSDKHFFAPLFVQPMKVELIDGNLRLEPTNQPAPNMSWLKYHFRNYDERTGFLRFVGFEDGPFDELSVQEEVSTKKFSLADLAVLSSKYLGDDIKEPINPGQISFCDSWNNREEGIYNSCLLSLGSGQPYSRSLLRELRHIADHFTDEELDRSALSAIFPYEKSAQSYIPDKPKEDIALIASFDLLNEEQRKGVEIGLSCKAGAITGPPGTGKSLVVRTILINQAVRSHATLFASKNHRALDAVEGPLNKISSNGPLVIRTAYGDGGIKNSWHEVLKDLLNRPSSKELPIEPLRNELFNILLKMNVKIKELKSICELTIDYQQCSDRLSLLIDRLPAHLLNDKKIKDIYNFKTDIDFNLINKSRLYLAQKTLSLWDRIIRLLFWQNKIKHKRALASIGSDITELIGKLPGNDDNVKWTKWLELAEIIKSINHVHTSLTEMEEKVSEFPGRDNLAMDIQKLHQSSMPILQTISDALASGQTSVIGQEQRRMLAGLRSGIANFGLIRLKKAMSENLPDLLSLFPLWATSSLSVKNALPLTAGAFDLLIVDEASQCDIASTIPLLARARRILAVGDPMQLSHICSMDQQSERTFLRSYNLTSIDIQRYSYRTNSFFDLTRNQLDDENDFIFLRDHFRCHPDIAEYASKSFYGGDLNIRTDYTCFKKSKAISSGLDWVHIDGEILKPPGGSGAISQSEAKYIVEAVTKLSDSRYDGTIGVVTPFKAQSDLILEQAYRNINRKFLVASDFNVGTAHAYQGDERDVMFLSLCASDSAPDGAMRFLAKEKNLYNVAVTRAKASLCIVGNKIWARNCGISFIEKCVQTIDTIAEKRTQQKEHPFQSPWEELLHRALIESGVDSIPQYPVAGRYLDMAILNPIKLDIEVDGAAYHKTASGRYKDDDIWRDIQLASLGWQICRFWVHELRDNMSGCVDIVKKYLDGTNIEDRRAY